MEEFKKILTSVILSTRVKNLTITSLDTDYRNLIGERIPFRKLEFSSLENCLRSIPDVLEVSGHGPEAAILVRLRGKSAQIKELVTKQRVNVTKRRYPVPERPLRTNNVIYHNFNQSSRSNDAIYDHLNQPVIPSCSVNLADVSTPSTSVTSKGAIPKLKLDSPPQINLNTTADWGICLSDSSTDNDEQHKCLVKTVTVQPGKDHKLFYKPKGIPKDYDEDVRKPICNEEADDKPSTEASVDPADLAKCMEKKWVYPDDVIHMHEEIPRQFIPSDFEDDFVDVIVVEVYDPSKFWLLFHDSCDSLNNLVLEMQIFYTTYDTYIPLHMIAVGMYCVAIYNSEFHRAVIVNKMTNLPSKVKVYYLDYGTVGVVSSDSLKFLHRKFCGLPQQAVRARLCGIYPSIEKTQWSMDASNRFLELSRMKPLVAHVYHIDVEMQTLNVFLADTSGDDDIYINDTLVKEGHAIFSSQEQQKVNLEPRSTPWVKWIHLYPTFDEIECNSVPNASELYQLAQTGMPLELIHPQYFGQRQINKEGLNVDLIGPRSHEQTDNRALNNCELESINEELTNTKLVNEVVSPKCEPVSTINEETNSFYIPSNDLKLSDRSTIESGNKRECSEKLNAIPAIRLPPPFEKMPSSSSFAMTHVGYNNMENPFVAQTTNVSSTIPNIKPSNSTLNQTALAYNIPQNHYQPYIQQTHSYILHQPHPDPATVNQNAPSQVPFLNYAPLQQVILPQLVFPSSQSNNIHFYGNFGISPSQGDYLNQIKSSVNPKRMETEMLLCNKLKGRRKLQEYFIKFLQSHQYSPSITLMKHLCDQLVLNLSHKPGLIVDELHYNTINCLVNGLDDAEFFQLLGAVDAIDYVSSKLEQQISLGTPTGLHNIQTDIHIRNKRQLVIKTELNGFAFHVIWYKQEPHVFLKEVVNFLKIIAAMEEIKKHISFIENEDVTIINLELWKYTEIYYSLSRYIKLNPNIAVPIIRTTSIPKIVPVLQAVFLPGSEKIQFEEFLESVKANKYLWFESK